MCDGKGCDYKLDWFKSAQPVVVLSILECAHTFNVNAPYIWTFAKDLLRFDRSKFHHNEILETIAKIYSWEY